MLQQVLLYILIFISGLFFGSFLNLVSDRILKKEKILFGRSKCENCKKPLKPTHLIPLLSFILQRGKCAMCSKKLSWYYPFSEVLTGLAFAGAVYYTDILKSVSVPSIISLVFLLVVFSAYIIIVLTDLKFRIIPDKVVWPTIIFVFLFMVINAIYYLVSYYVKLKNDIFGVYLLESGYLHVQGLYILKSLGMVVLSACLIAGFFAFLVKITKGKGMGGGDVKLGLLIGLFNGFPNNVIAIFLGFIIGAVTSLVLILFKLKTMKDTVPFGPFLILGSLVALLWGEQLWQFYITLF
ncbi:prepilin peptidase [Patescibacteria group bacterium]